MPPPRRREVPPTTWACCLESKRSLCDFVNLRVVDGPRKVIAARTLAPQHQVTACVVGFEVLGVTRLQRESPARCERAEARAGRLAAEYREPTRFMVGN